MCGKKKKGDRWILTEAGRLLAGCRLMSDMEMPSGSVRA